jgi:phosphodiesterase/alkaline phosphatase D-like protein
LAINFKKTATSGFDHDALIGITSDEPLVNFANFENGHHDEHDHNDPGPDDHGHPPDQHISPLPYNATAFPDGVASGDVTQTSAVLWTRASHTGRVTFQVATDPGFHHIVDTLTVNVTNTLVPAKVQVDDLHADQRYYYRAVDAAGHVAEGTLQTAARLGHHEGFTFGAAGDSQGELAPYPSLKNAPTAGLDLFVKLGDIPYADASSPAGRSSWSVRRMLSTRRYTTSSISISFAISRRSRPLRAFRTSWR